MDAACILPIDPAGSAVAKGKGCGNKERVIYSSFFIQEPLKELFTKPKEDKRILKIEITCYCQFRLSEEFPNIPQLQLVETFFDEQLGNFDGCVHMLDSVFKGVGCSFILYRTINKNVYPNGSYDYSQYCNKIERLRAEVDGGGHGVAAGDSQPQALMARPTSIFGGAREPGAKSDSLFSSFSVTNSTVSKMFRDFELENEFSAPTRSRRASEAAAATAAGAGVSTGARRESTSQDSLDSLEDFSCLEVAVDCLEDIVNDNYEFVIEEMFFEAITAEVRMEERDKDLRRIGAHFVDSAIYEHVARCYLVSQSLSQVARSLVEPTSLVDQTCNDCFNDNATVICTSDSQSSTAYFWGCGGADTNSEIDIEYDDYDADANEVVDADGNDEDYGEDAADNQSTAYDCDSTVDISESIFDRRWSSAGGGDGGGGGVKGSSLHRKNYLQPLVVTPTVCEWPDESNAEWQQQEPAAQQVPLAATNALDDFFNGCCTAIVQEACLETLIGLVGQRLVIVLYKSSRSKSQFECRIVKALACFNQLLRQFAAKPADQINLALVAEGFFNFVVDTAMDPEALRIGHMSSVVTALQAPMPVRPALAMDEGLEGPGRHLLSITRDAFVSAVRDRLTSLGAKLVRKSGAPSGSQQAWQNSSAQRAAVEVFEVASNSSSDELESLPSESAATTGSNRNDVRPERTVKAKKASTTPARNTRAPCGGRLLQYQRRFGHRLERISEAIRQPLAAGEIDLVETSVETTLPLPACAPAKRMRAQSLSHGDKAASVASDAETDGDTDRRSVSGSDCGYAYFRLQGSSDQFVRASTVQSTLVADETIDVWQVSMLRRCEVTEEAADQFDKDGCLSLEYPIIGHGSLMSAGRLFALTVAVVSEAGAPLCECVTEHYGVRAAEATAEVSAAELLESRVLEFSTASALAAEAPTVSWSLNQPALKLHLAVARIALQLTDAAEQPAMFVRGPPTPLLGDCPALSMSSASQVEFCRHAWTVHAGVRHSNSHCCPLSQLRQGQEEVGHLARSHLERAPTSGLEITSASDLRCAASVAADVRDAVGAYAVRASFIGNASEQEVPSARSCAAALYLCAVASQSSGGRTAASSFRDLAEPDRALAVASDWPTPGGGEHWPVRSVREWRWAEASGHLRPAIAAPASALVCAAAAHRSAALFDAGGCVGRLPVTPASACQLPTAEDCFAGSAAQTAAIECGIAEFQPTVSLTPMAVGVVSSGRLVVSPQPAYLRCRSAGDGSDCAQADEGGDDTDSAPSYASNSSCLEIDLPHLDVPQASGSPGGSGAGHAQGTAAHTCHHYQLRVRSFSASSIAWTPSSHGDMLDRLTRQQAVLDCLLTEKIRVHARRARLDDVSTAVHTADDYSSNWTDSTDSKD